MNTTLSTLTGNPLVLGLLYLISFGLSAWAICYKRRIQQQVRDVIDMGPDDFVRRAIAQAEAANRARSDLSEVAPSGVFVVGSNITVITHVHGSQLSHPGQPQNGSTDHPQR